MRHWVRESREGGRNLDLNDQPQSGRSVSTTQNLKRQKLANLLKKINFKIYVQPLKRLKQKSITFVQGSESPMPLQHDNARPHVSTTTSAAIENIGFKVVVYSPYSLNLAPSDFCFFAALK